MLKALISFSSFIYLQIIDQDNYLIIIILNCKLDIEFGQNILFFQINFIGRDNTLVNFSCFEIFGIIIQILELSS